MEVMETETETENKITGQLSCAIIWNEARACDNKNAEHICLDISSSSIRCVQCQKVLKTTVRSQKMRAANEYAFIQKSREILIIIPEWEIIEKRKQLRRLSYANMVNKYNILFILWTKQIDCFMDLHTTSKRGEFGWLFIGKYMGSSFYSAVCNKSHKYDNNLSSYTLIANRQHKLNKFMHLLKETPSIFVDTSQSQELFFWHFILPLRALGIFKYRYR